MKPKSGSNNFYILNKTTRTTTEMDAPSYIYLRFI